MILFIMALLLVSGCVPDHAHWTRAEVAHHPERQQAALEKDRGACVDEEMKRPVLYQFIMGALDVESCLERKGWKRTP